MNPCVESMIHIKQEMARYCTRISRPILYLNRGSLILKRCFSLPLKYIHFNKDESQ
jgi:hypothetical protein